MKVLSKYNYLYPIGDVTVLYNIISDNILLLRPQIVQLIESYKNNIGQLKEIHPEFFEKLEENSMLLNTDKDEILELIDRWKKEEKESSSFFLTIYPTIDCNLRCWYCYESHENNACMDNDTVLKVRKLIRNVICRKKIKNLFLSFFGGEPLLRFEEIVKPFISYTRDMCKDHNVDLYIDITSNGVLMTDDVINDLLSLELNNTPLFQITLDGNRKEHNKVKFTKNGRGTYDIIINNIKNALKAGIPINNRLNYTQKNIDSLIDVLNEYSELTKEERKNLLKRIINPFSSYNDL